MLVSDGILAKNALKALIPPAEAPTPTIRRGFSAGWRACGGSSGTISGIAAAEASVDSSLPSALVRRDLDGISIQIEMRLRLLCLHQIYFKAKSFRHKRESAQDVCRLPLKSKISSYGVAAGRVLLRGSPKKPVWTFVQNRGMRS
nr:hypothetical protein [uncultured Rhodopila sp.]